MNQRSHAGRFPSPPGIIVLAIVVAGCASSTQTPSPSTAPPSPTAATASAAPTPTAKPTAAPSTAPSPSAAPSPLAADFTTKAPGSALPAWTGIAWEPIAASDPVATLTGMAAAPMGGYVAWANPVAIDASTSASPLWSSTDGASWHALPADTLGPAGVVLGIGTVGGNLVALTLRGGANQCGDNPVPSCWTLAAPLEAWTSADGATWTASTAPEIATHEDCDGCGVTAPSVAFGAPGVIAWTQGEAGRQLAMSMDGTTWTPVPDGALPASMQLSQIGAYSGGFIAVGDNGKNPARAETATSSDGLRWHADLLPVQADPGNGASVHRALTGAQGILLDGSDQATPGRTLWWTSPDAAKWRVAKTYAPLGVWKGEGEGSGLLPDGSVAADGQRILALRTDGEVASWTSPDGRTWTSIPSTGLTAQPAGSWPAIDMRIVPIGVVATDQTGASWLGVPAQGG